MFSEKAGRVRINSNLLKSIDSYLESETAKSKGFKSRRDVIEEAVRRFLEEEGFWSSSRFKHLNMDRDYVIILDRFVRRVVTVYFKHPDRVYCDLCRQPYCEHVLYALTLENVSKILKKRGFKIVCETVEDYYNTLHVKNPSKNTIDIMEAR